MNSKLLYFVGGFLAGCGGMYLVMKRRMDQQLEDEIANVKATYSKKAAEKKESEEDTKKMSEEALTRAAEEAKKIAAENAKRKTADIASYTKIMSEQGYADTHKVSYNLFSNPPKASDIPNGADEDEDDESKVPAGVDEDDDPDILDTTPPNDARGPYVLENDDLSTAAYKFVNEEPNFEKTTLFFYDDGVLCSEEYEIITNIAETVGEEALRRIGEFEPDVAYVRNEKQCTDYEIIRQYTDFATLPQDP